MRLLAIIDLEIDRLKNENFRQSTASAMLPKSLTEPKDAPLDISAPKNANLIYKLEQKLHWHRDKLSC